MFITRYLRIAAIPAMILAFGCSSTSSMPSPSEEPPTPTAAETATDTPARAEAGTDDVGDVLALRSPIYFDTNAAGLRGEALDMLSSYARTIVDHPEWGVLSIEGHCDERGSAEYNLALGQRRANAVERRLIEMGVPRSRLATRTLGSQAPAVRGHGEEAWRYNRRSELRIEAEDVLASTAR
jgi:peptidoglycan-associated lipoprotein